ncbi:hypothetical protein GE061_001915 [Apolygus lucorum]|uniref:Uncharacterized protein n=1 Tax=Apolygus lucorum TaxID=248454 RepID=A0A8S9X3Q2_APOLU|nr:hypothetical protein GE061_001915 [Apolygus lucorum]
MICTVESPRSPILEVFRSRVIYYENAHHQHHYDHHDHEDHGHGWGLWGRSGEEASSTPSSGPLSYINAIFSRRDNDPSDLAYSAYRVRQSHPEEASPPHNSIYGVPPGPPAPAGSYRSMPSSASLSKTRK